MKYMRYKDYENVGKWWENEGRGKFPGQVAGATSLLQEKYGLTFRESFEFLVDNKVLIIINNREVKHENSKNRY